MEFIKEFGAYIIAGTLLVFGVCGCIYLMSYIGMLCLRNPNVWIESIAPTVWILLTVCVFALAMKKVDE